jgi:hypothetical protein
MSKPDPTMERENAEFAALALKSLAEGVRRALIEHEQRGQLVAGWSMANVEWVAPGESLSLYPAGDRSGAAANAVQGGATDGQTPSRLARG